jgi:hypothetical protein
MDFFYQYRLNAEIYYKKCDEYRKCLINDIENICRHVESRSQKILIWGYNQNFIRLFNTISSLNLDYDVVDSSKQKQLLNHFKIKIRNPEEIHLDDYATVFICATNAHDEIRNIILNSSTLSKDRLHKVDFASV